MEGLLSTGPTLSTFHFESKMLLNISFLNFYNPQISRVLISTVPSSQFLGCERLLLFSSKNLLNMFAIAFCPLWFFRGKLVYLLSRLNPNSKFHFRPYKTNQHWHSILLGGFGSCKEGLGMWGGERWEEGGGFCSTWGQAACDRKVLGVREERFKKTNSWWFGSSLLVRASKLELYLSMGKSGCI